MQETMPSFPVRLLLLAALGLVTLGCTAESTLHSLQNDFSKRKAELNELKVIMLKLSLAAKDFRFFSSRVAGGGSDMLDFFDNKSRVPVSQALEAQFQKNREDLLTLQSVVRKLGIHYVSVDKSNEAVWVTIEGGGVLASDKGYLFAGKKDITEYHLDHYAPIPSEDKWYAFVD